MHMLLEWLVSYKRTQTSVHNPVYLRLLRLATYSVVFINPNSFFFRSSPSSFCRYTQPSPSWYSQFPWTLIKLTIFFHLHFNLYAHVFKSVSWYQGIDLVAGGKSKRTKRNAPRSDDIYLKLLVKVILLIRFHPVCFHFL